jgi:branched-chain amino acid transport system ATP-binding protein
MEEMGNASQGDGFAARGLTVRFGGITALDDVSVAIKPGEILGVIGPNGAGKTTLFNVICGFVRPQSGTLSWKGQALGTVRTNRLAGLGIARTLQGVALFPELTVLENVMVGAQRFRRAGIATALLGLPRSVRDERALRARAFDALSQLDCEQMAERLPRTLPYPVQKRVALARALVSEPQLLLLDEPAGGLDGGDMQELERRIGEMRGTRSVMLVEHRMDLVMSVCDRIVVLDFGQVIAEGEPASIARNARVLEAYLGGEPAATEQGTHAPGELGEVGT